MQVRANSSRADGCFDGLPDGSQSVWFQPVHRKNSPCYQGRARKCQPAIGDRFFRLLPNHYLNADTSQIFRTSLWQIISSLWSETVAEEIAGNFPMAEVKQIATLATTRAVNTNENACPRRPARPTRC